MANRDKTLGSTGRSWAASYPEAAPPKRETHIKIKKRKRRHEERRKT